MSELHYLQATLSSELTSLNSSVISVDGTMRSLSGNLEECKNQTLSQLADLQDPMDILDSKLVSLNFNVTENLKSTEGQLDAKLDELDSELLSVHNRMRDDLNWVKTDLSSLNVTQ